MYRTEAYLPQTVQMLHPQEATICHREQYNLIF